MAIFEPTSPIWVEPGTNPSYELCDFKNASPPDSIACELFDIFPVFQSEQAAIRGGDANFAMRSRIVANMFCVTKLDYATFTMH